MWSGIARTAVGVDVDVVEASKPSDLRVKQYLLSHNSYHVQTKNGGMVNRWQNRLLCRLDVDDTKPEKDDDGKPIFEDKIAERWNR